MLSSGVEVFFFPLYLLWKLSVVFIAGTVLLFEAVLLQRWESYSAPPRIEMWSTGFQYRSLCRKSINNARREIYSRFLFTGASGATRRYNSQIQLARFFYWWWSCSRGGRGRGGSLGIRQETFYFAVWWRKKIIEVLLLYCEHQQVRHNLMIFTVISKASPGQAERHPLTMFQVVWKIYVIDGGKTQRWYHIYGIEIYHIHLRVLCLCYITHLSEMCDTQIY